MSTSKTSWEEFVFTLQVDPSMLKTRLKAAVVKGFENDLIVRPKNSEYEGKKPKAMFTPTEKPKAKVKIIQMFVVYPLVIFVWCLIIFRFHLVWIGHNWIRLEEMIEELSPNI